MADTSYILGISAYYHDAAAALLRDGQIVAAAQEARFSRRKHDPAFPHAAIQYCLREAGLGVEELSLIAFYDKPWLKFERLLESHLAYAPWGLPGFVRAMPGWLKEKFFLRRRLREGLQALGPFDPKQVPLLFPSHHLSHAASAFYPSPFAEAAVLTLDGVGEWATATLGHGQGADLTRLRTLSFPHSLGLLYSAMTWFLGFDVLDGEYKVMGLAAYGDPEASLTRRFRDLIETELIDLQPDGSFRLNMAWFRFATGDRMIPTRRWARLFGLPRRSPGAPLTRAHAHLARALQEVTQAVVLSMATELKELTGARHLCLAGGVALNGVAVGQILAAGLYESVWVQPAAGDAGGALGAALAAYHIHQGGPRPDPGGRDAMQGARLGPAPDPVAVARLARQHAGPVTHFATAEACYEAAAARLAAGEVVGWIQGRMEFGPRALGSRSILADPRNPGMQARLNAAIKGRESFRPFGMAILEEAAPAWVDLHQAAPYMQLVCPLQPDKRQPMPAGSADWDFAARLAVPRSPLPAVTHVDYGIRVQTVGPAGDPALRALLRAFQARTGCPALINTSFNRAGEPLVCTAEEAYAVFMATEMDYLIIDNTGFGRPQPPRLSA